MVLITKHWLERESLKMIHITNFNLVPYYCRRNTIHGGSAIYSSKDLSATPNNAVNHLAADLTFECCSVTVCVGKMKYVLVCVYRSPSSDFSQFCDKLEQLLILSA